MRRTQHLNIKRYEYSFIVGIGFPAPNFACFLAMLSCYGRRCIYGNVSR